MANKPAGAATPKDAADPASAGRIKQIRMVAGIIRKQNPRALPIVVLAGIGVLAVFVIVGIFTHLLAFLLPLGLASGLLVSMIIFGRYAQSAQYAAVEGQPGAAAAIMQSMRGGWTVTPAVSANRNMDVVHRAVGKPGVVLVGEGSPNRLGSLLAAEKKRVSRVAFDVPIYDLQVGNEEGQIPIRKLQRKMMRLPRNLKGPAVADLNFRLKALPQSLQAPKGPMPRTGRMPKPPRAPPQRAHRPRWPNTYNGYYHASYQPDCPSAHLDQPAASTRPASTPAGRSRTRSSRVRGPSWDRPSAGTTAAG